MSKKELVVDMTHDEVTAIAMHIRAQGIDTGILTEDMGAELFGTVLSYLAHGGEKEGVLERITGTIATWKKFKDNQLTVGEMLGETGVPQIDAYSSMTYSECAAAHTDGSSTVH